MLGVGEVAATGGRAGEVGALARDQLHAHRVPDLPQRLRQLVGDPVGHCVGEVAEQDGDVGAEESRIADTAGGGVPAGRLDVCRGAAAAGRGLVHHVVVDEREQVERLEGGGGADEVPVVRGPVRATGGEEAPVAHRHAQPLAATDEQFP